MADIRDNIPEESLESPQEETKRFSMIKVGIPVLIIQIIVSYFLANYLIVPMFFDQASAHSSSRSAEVSEEAAPADSGEDEEQEREYGVIHQLEDIIVNPAESQGSQFLLINLAFEVKSEDDVELLKQREVIVRDILIQLLSGKTLLELDGPDDKELLRKEIIERVSKVLPKGHLYNVYFSNYIIQ
ncbi:MAG: flagellar basal body-associated FliL family protein [Calditrichaeota bacterium]|nr:flagellar basal body-associated FliL family protein [Calditrichota bacterium]